MTTATDQRYAELDMLRAFAVFGMVLYHLLYDLVVFYGWDIPIFDDAWRLFARAVASLFLLLVGISFAVSWGRHRPRHERFWHAYGKYLRRGLGLIACGMLVSIATYVMNPATYVRFGILHLIGTSILLLPFFKAIADPFGQAAHPRRGAAREIIFLLMIGFLIIVTGTRLRSISLETSFLLPLGITPSRFATVDYFPLLPWLGVVLIGVAMGLLLSVQGALRWHLPCRTAFCRAILWPGRHALAIYLVHQPVLLGLLALLLGERMD